VSSAWGGGKGGDLQSGGARGNTAGWKQQTHPPNQPKQNPTQTEPNPNRTQPKQNPNHPPTLHPPVAPVLPPRHRQRTAIGGCRHTLGRTGQPQLQQPARSPRPAPVHTAAAVRVPRREVRLVGGAGGPQARARWQRCGCWRWGHLERQPVDDAPALQEGVDPVVVEAVGWGLG